MAPVSLCLSPLSFLSLSLSLSLFLCLCVCNRTRIEEIDGLLLNCGTVDSPRGAAESCHTGTKDSQRERAR